MLSNQEEYRGMIASLKLDTVERGFQIVKGEIKKQGELPIVLINKAISWV